ncbi:hypothetical protein Drorol1_Dr00027561, partial [Drosera rotundifolia]
MSVSSSLSVLISSESIPKDVPITSGVNVADSSSDQSPLEYTGGAMTAHRAGVCNRSSHQVGTSASPSQQPLHPTTLGANFESNLTAREVVYYPGRFECLGYEFCVPALKERPFDARVGWLAVFMDCLQLGQHLPLCPYYQEVLGLYNSSPAQLTPNSWALMAAFGVLCHELGSPLSAFMFCTFFKIAKGQGITLNPRWRKPIAKPDIPLLDAEVGLKIQIQRLIEDGTVREVKDLIDLELLKATKLRARNAPMNASSSSGSSGSSSGSLGSSPTSSFLSTLGVPSTLLFPEITCPGQPIPCFPLFRGIRVILLGWMRKV